MNISNTVQFFDHHFYLCDFSSTVLKFTQAVWFSKILLWFWLLFIGIFQSLLNKDLRKINKIMRPWYFSLPFTPAIATEIKREEMAADVNRDKILVWFDGLCRIPVRARYFKKWVFLARSSEYLGQRLIFWVDVFEDVQLQLCSTYIS